MSTVCYILLLGRPSKAAIQHHRSSTPWSTSDFPVFFQLFPRGRTIFFREKSLENHQASSISSEASDMEDDQDDFTDEADVASRGFTPQVRKFGRNWVPYRNDNWNDIFLVILYNSYYKLYDVRIIITYIITGSVGTGNNWIGNTCWARSNYWNMYYN